MTGPLLDVDDAPAVRAAVTTFTREGSRRRFVLVPLVPLAEPAHYDAVRQVLRSCDVVVTATGGSPGGGGDVNPVAPLAGGRHLRLATPPSRWDEVGVPFLTVEAGSTPATGAGTAWAEAAAKRLTPTVAALAGRVVTRAHVAKMLAYSTDRALSSAPAPVGGGRRATASERLATTVRRLHDERGGADDRVGVVHWLDGLPTVARALGALGYQPVGVEWIPVFGWLDDGPGA